MLMCSYSLIGEFNVLLNFIYIVSKTQNGKLEKLEEGFGMEENLF